MKLTPEQLAELKQLAVSATPGPWKHDIECNEVGFISESDEDQSYGMFIPVGGMHSTADSYFTAAAREAVPALITDLEELQAKLSAAEKNSAALREAIDDAAYEWAQYVEVDTAPCTLQDHTRKAIDAAIAAQEGK